MEVQDRYVNDVEAAKLLSVSPQTLRNWRHIGRGPKYSKKSTLVRYFVRDLLDYMDSGSVNPEARGAAG